MKKLIYVLAALAICWIQSVSAQEKTEKKTDGFREIEKIYIKGTESVHFFLDKQCPQKKPYYTLVKERVDVERFYSTVLAAFVAGKAIEVYWEPAKSCEVTRLRVR
ncbi:hypothetical protein ACFL17_02845 [Pseudomonadota bacterium]